LCQNLSPGRLIHIFIHSGHGNPTFGTTYPLTALLSPSRVTILLAQFAAYLCCIFLLIAGKPPVRMRLFGLD
ncbi:MAG: hypothetical protein NTW03_14100, partial [Verrucomicrobia bacterium]|nr:hypothetical protein [Verrucomicrobiota bacterium]